MTEDLSEFLKYIAAGDQERRDRIPPLADLSHELGINIARLREQMEVARVMGLIEVKPRTGIKRLNYKFSPAVVKSLEYALTINPAFYKQYSDLRRNIESSFWLQAVSQLTETDISELRAITVRAGEKLHSIPIQIPHPEHRSLHLTFYRRLDNPFVTGLLEAYWDVYEKFGLDIYTDLIYQERVWDYHTRIVTSICNQKYQDGHTLLIEHMNLIVQRHVKPPNMAFE
jgi:DNA-binding FadR family transcriptional regulator